MKQDLLAPPRLTVRRFALIIAALAAMAFLAGMFMAVEGMLTFGELAVRLPLVAVVCGGVIWVYARLMRAATQARPERMPLIHAATSIMGLIAMYAIMGIMVGGTGLGSVGTGIAWMIPMMVGMTLAMGGWARRVGESRHCPRCEYEFKFDVEADAPSRCPECGTGWLGLLKKGRRIKSPKMMAAGIALAVAGMVILQPIFYMGFLAPHLPTPLLFASLYREPKTFHTAWIELGKRPLNPRWTRIMAERLLRYREHAQWDNSPSQWFEAMVAKGRMPAELVERSYHEGFKAMLILPTSVKAGEPFTAKLRVTRAVDGWTSKLGIMFGGFAVGNTSPEGSRPEAAWGYELRPVVFSHHRDAIEQRLVAPQPGLIRVRTVYWVVYQPTFSAITWQEDGTPLRPGTASWFERVELEATVQVR